MRCLPWFNKLRHIFNNLGKKLDPLFLKIVSSQTNIRNAIFDQRSTRPPEVGVSRWHRHTDIHTDGHGDLLTNSAQWGRVGENTQFDYIVQKGMVAWPADWTDAISHMELKKGIRQFLPYKKNVQLNQYKGYLLKRWCSDQLLNATMLI